MAATTINASAITVGISIGATSQPQHIYAPVVTVAASVTGAYLPPKPVAPPAGVVVAPILLTQRVMPTPTIVNGRPV